MKIVQKFNSFSEYKLLLKASLHGNLQPWDRFSSLQIMVTIINTIDRWIFKSLVKKLNHFEFIWAFVSLSELRYNRWKCWIRIGNGIVLTAILYQCWSSLSRFQSWIFSLVFSQFKLLRFYNSIKNCLALNSVSLYLLKATCWGMIKYCLHSIKKVFAKYKC